MKPRLNVQPKTTGYTKGDGNLRYSLLWLGIAALGSGVICLLYLSDGISLLKPVFNLMEMWKVGLQSGLPKLQIDYPRYYWLAWILTKGVLILAVITGYLIIQHRWKTRQPGQTIKLSLPSWLQYTAHPSFYRNFGMHLLNLLGPLLVILLFYGLGNVFMTLAADDWNALQLSLARWYILIIYGYLILLVLNQRAVVKQTIAYFFLEPSSAKSLAVFRFLFFTYLATVYLTIGPFFNRWIQANEVAGLPLWGETSALFGYVVPYYKLLFHLGAGCSLLIALGLFTRYMLVVNAVLCFLIVATPNFFGKLWHNQLFIWVSWLFVASRCYDAWSVDAWWARKRGRPFGQSLSSAYSIPIRWLWAHMGIIYFFAGIYKLWNSGFDWALSSSMVNQIQTEWVQHYDQVPLPRIDYYPTLIKLGGLCLILFEMLFPFLLIKPATRIFATLGGLSFHNLSAHYMYIGFYNIQHMYIAFLHNIKRSFFPQPLPSQQPSWKDLKWKQSSTVFKIGLIIFSLNFLCGFFSIHTYPFSSYPTYSALVPEEIDLIHFAGFDQTGKKIDVLAEAQKAHFRREDCTIFETQIVEAWKNGQAIDTLVENYWHLWQSNIPTLFKVTHIQVYYHRTPVQPERRKEFIINELIYESR